MKVTDLILLSQSPQAGPKVRSLQDQITGVQGMRLEQHRTWSWKSQWTGRELRRGESVQGM
jgi:hypothetical protein